MTNATDIELRPRHWWTIGFVLIGLLLGCGVGFVLNPIGSWVLELLGGVPAPVRIAMTLPLVWQVPVLGVLGGLLGGLFVAAEGGEKAALKLTVSDDRLIFDQHGHTRVVPPRGTISAIFADGKDLVVNGAADRQIVRYKATDISIDAVADALRTHRYPWTARRTRTSTSTRPGSTAAERPPRTRTTRSAPGGVPSRRRTDTMRNQPRPPPLLRSRSARPPGGRPGVSSPGQQVDPIRRFPGPRAMRDMPTR